MFWGSTEIMLPVYQHMSEAVSKHPDARILVNFASLRVAYEVTMEAMQVNSFENPDEIQIKCIVIIAEGIPEQWTRIMIQRSKDRGCLLIGPATVSFFCFFKLFQFWKLEKIMIVLIIKDCFRQFTILLNSQI